MCLSKQYWLQSQINPGTNEPEHNTSSFLTLVTMRTRRLKHMASKVKDLHDVKNDTDRAMWKRNSIEDVEWRLRIKWKQETEDRGDWEELKSHRE